MENKINFQSFVTSCDHATSHSFVAALSIGTYEKPFTDCELLKNAFINYFKHLFNEFANEKEIIERSKEMLLSARTVQRNVEDMAKNIYEQAKYDLLPCFIKNRYKLYW